MYQAIVDEKEEEEEEFDEDGDDEDEEEEEDGELMLAWLFDSDERLCLHEMPLLLSLFPSCPLVAYLELALR